MAKVTKEINLCQDLLTIENIDSDVKVHALHLTNTSCLCASDFALKNFWKHAQHAEIIRKNDWKKGNGAYSLSIIVQTTINHISIFFTTI